MALFRPDYTAHPGSSRLLSIPVEIRHHILTEVLVVTDIPISIFIVGNGEISLGGPLFRSSRQHLAILRTCYGLYAEGYPIFFRYNTFILFEPDLSLYNDNCLLTDNSGIRALKSCKSNTKAELLSCCIWPCDSPIRPVPFSHWERKGHYYKSQFFYHFYCMEHPPLRYVRHLIIATTCSEFGSKIGLFIESLVRSETEIRTLFLIGVEQCFLHKVNYPDPRLLWDLRPLIPALEHLVKKSNISLIHISTLSEGTQYMKLDIDKATWIQRYIMARSHSNYCTTGGYRSSPNVVCSEGFFFSSIYDYNLYPFSDRYEEPGLLNNTDAHSNQEWRTSTTLSTVLWSYSSSSQLKYTIQKATQSSPSRGCLDIKEMNFFCLDESERYYAAYFGERRSHRWVSGTLNEIVEALELDILNEDIFPLCPTHDENVEIADRWGELGISWDTTEEYDYLRAIGLRWMLGDAATRSGQRKITDYFQRQKRQ